MIFDCIVFVCIIIAWGIFIDNFIHFLCYAHFELEPQLRTELIFSVNVNAQTKHGTETLNTNHKFIFMFIQLLQTQRKGFEMSKFNNINHVKIENWYSHHSNRSETNQHNFLNRKERETSKLSRKKKQNRTVCTNKRCTENSHLPICCVNISLGKSHFRKITLLFHLFLACWDSLTQSAHGLDDAKSKNANSSNTFVRKHVHFFFSKKMPQIINKLTITNKDNCGQRAQTKY